MLKMDKINLSEAIDLYDKGEYTLSNVYTCCETDLDMYNFLSCHCGYGDDKVKEKMVEISGADDAYYNALE